MTPNTELRGEVGLRGVALDAFIGWSDEERAVRQPVKLDIVLSYDLLEAARSDNLERGVDYVEAYNVLSRLVLERSFRLLERLCLEAAGEILVHLPRVLAASVCCQKTIMHGTDATFCSLTLTREQWETLSAGKQ